MRVIVLYHPNNDEFSGIVQDYADEFEKYKRKKLELLSLETVEGAQLAELYAVVQYPAILIMSNDGGMLRLWQGTPLPLMDELSYYIQDESAPLRQVSRIIQPLAA
jgi:hypothetical protein